MSLNNKKKTPTASDVFDDDFEGSTKVIFRTSLSMMTMMMITVMYYPDYPTLIIPIISEKMIMTD